MVVSSGTLHTSIKSYTLYLNGTTDSSNLFSNKAIPFIDGNAFTSYGVIIKNDNAAPGATIQFSFDGINIHGDLFAQEDITLDGKRATQLFLRSTADSNFRIWCW